MILQHKMQYKTRCWLLLIFCLHLAQSAIYTVKPALLKHSPKKVLNLPSFVYRRHRMDMIMMYKIIHGLDGSLFHTFFLHHDVPTRSNGYKLFKKFCHLNIRKYSFHSGWSITGILWQLRWCRCQMLNHLKLSLICLESI